MEPITVQGRRLDAADLSAIQSLIDANPTWSRWRIANELVVRWDWRNGAGRLKDMSCRRMLARLGERGLLRLPVRRQIPPCRASRLIAKVPVDETPVICPLRSVQPITLERIDYHTAAAGLFDSLLSEHHYLGHAYPIGANVRYLARAADGRPVACAIWASAALKVTARDRWIGWDSGQRMRSLSRLANNTRFCVLPWVRVPHLASHLLGLMVRRLRSDWREATGSCLALVETFVDTERFRGTCYRAANWLDLGRTKGRTRDDRNHSIRVPIKDVRVLPLLPLARLRRELAR
jgi:hypothetical protein